MAQTPSGAISLGDINTALGRTSTASININDSQVRFIANQDTGAVDMNAMRNKWTFNGTITVGFSAGYGYDIYGYDSAGGFGSITGGPLWYGRALDVLYAGTNLESLIQTYASGTAFPNVTMRLKVGTNATVAMTWDSGGFYFYSNTQQAILAADYLQTRDWQFSQT